MITAGYTGTEGYGITITQSVGGTIQNVTIRDVETHHGFATGVALFKDSSVQFDGVIVDGITAGSQLNVEQLRPEMDYLPNKVPIACSIFDNQYGTDWSVTNEVIASNVEGFLLCDGDAMIGECDSDSCIARYEQTYFDGLREDTVEQMRKKGVMSSLWRSMTEEHSANDHDDSVNFRQRVHLLSMALIVTSLFVIIVVGIFKMLKWNSLRKVQIGHDDLDYGNLAERMPLLVH